MFLETVEFNIHEKLNLIKIKKNGVDPFDFSSRLIWGLKKEGFIYKIQENMQFLLNYNYINFVNTKNCK